MNILTSTSLVHLSLLHWILSLGVHPRYEVIESKSINLKKKILDVALAGVAQWNERQPVNGKVAGSTPSQGPCLGCGPGPQLGACERQPIDESITH